MNPKMQTRLDAMTTGLSLTPDQVSQVTQQMNNFLQTRRQLKQQNAPQDQIKQARQAMKQAVENVFTADQKAKYETNKAQYWQIQGADSDDDDADDKAAN